MESNDLIKGIWNLARSPRRNADDPRDDARTIQVLDALIASEDPGLVETVPVFLALSIQSGFSMDISPLLKTYAAPDPPRRHLTHILEMCFIIAVDLLDAEGCVIPQSALKASEDLRRQKGHIPTSDPIELGSGITLHIRRLRELFKAHSTPKSEPHPPVDDEPRGPLDPTSGKSHNHLRIIFSPKQEELIMKKLEGARFSKTEREYYSRVVKKKLMALADPSLQVLAARLLSK